MLYEINFLSFLLYQANGKQLRVVLSVFWVQTSLVDVQNRPQGFPLTPTLEMGGSTSY